VTECVHESRLSVRHYFWAGLDFMLDEDGTPVLLEANKSSHMLGEYMHFHRDERPFELAAAAMNEADGRPCFLWRRGEPFPDRDEDAPFIGKHLVKYLREAPVVCDVEDNLESRTELVSRHGTHVRPGSVFRWWYELPWSYERAGVRVINPNCLWVAVRDKLACYRTLQHATTFRVPRCFAVENADEARSLLISHAELLAGGFVLKPRVGWGGHGVQVGNLGDEPREVGGNYLLSERIHPPPRDGNFWDVRVFVMNGVYLGGVQYQSHTPITNYYQGGRPAALDAETTARLAPAALEAVALLDAAADAVHHLPEPPHTDLTKVDYT